MRSEKFMHMKLLGILLFYPNSLCFSLSVNPELTKLPSESLLVNGLSATDPRPFFVNISIDSGKTFCGGSIITAHWILTAAHCLSEFDSKESLCSNFSVSVGLF